eukprot:TRINITY_DN23122_c0_g1_i1.p1 TRINITY_DN23122_c0_g1~~TRINITY_DN23122_c0_g1_i1.p1  ORF type:complete len:553 (-),score=132.61 TRINITY_DN23122_c0_g1_i1:412-2070(-)
MRPATPNDRLKGEVAVLQELVDIVPGPILKKTDRQAFLTFLGLGQVNADVKEQAAVTEFIVRSVANAAYEMPLPPRWTEQVDVRGYVYFCHAFETEAVWEHPLTKAFQECLDLARRLADAQGTLPEAAKAVEEHLREVQERAAAALKDWSGPHHSKETGEEFFFNEETQASAWQSPLEMWQYELHARYWLLVQLLQALHGHENPPPPPKRERLVPMADSALDADEPPRFATLEDTLSALEETFSTMSMASHVRSAVSGIAYSLASSAPSFGANSRCVVVAACGLRSGSDFSPKPPPVPAPPPPPPLRHLPAPPRGRDPAPKSAMTASLPSLQKVVREAPQGAKPPPPPPGNPKRGAGPAFGYKANPPPKPVSLADNFQPPALPGLQPLSLADSFQSPALPGMTEPSRNLAATAPLPQRPLLEGPPPAASTCSNFRPNGTVPGPPPAAATCSSFTPNASRPRTPSGSSSPLSTDESPLPKYAAKPPGADAASGEPAPPPFPRTGSQATVKAGAAPALKVGWQGADGQAPVAKMGKSEAASRRPATMTMVCTVS